MDQEVGVAKVSACALQQHTATDHVCMHLEQALDYDVAPDDQPQTDQVGVCRFIWQFTQHP